MSLRTVDQRFLLGDKTRNKKIIFRNIPFNFMVKLLSIFFIINFILFSTINLLLVALILPTRQTDEWMTLYFNRVHNYSQDRSLPYGPMKLRYNISNYRH